jgi:hypothetical protein
MNTQVQVIWMNLFYQQTGKIEGEMGRKRRLLAKLSMYDVFCMLHILYSWDKGKLFLKKALI